MICSDFDPITASCAPSCCVCSQRRECTRSADEAHKRSENEARENGMNRERTEEKAAPDATNIQSGRVEKGLPTVFSTSSLQNK